MSGILDNPVFPETYTLAKPSENDSKETWENWFHRRVVDALVMAGVDHETNDPDNYEWSDLPGGVGRCGKPKKPLMGAMEGRPIDYQAERVLMLALRGLEAERSATEVS